VWLRSLGAVRPALGRSATLQFQQYPSPQVQGVRNGGQWQQHTTARNLQATMVNGTTNGQWLGYMLNAGPKWTDTLQ